MSVKEAKRRKYVLVAPDGGWGYMVGLGVILNLGALLGFSNCFGMLYKDLFIEINMDTTSVTLTTGVGCFSVALSGFLVGPLQKFFSLRQIGIVGALVFNLGAFCTAFVNSRLLFILSQGMIQGFGNGIIYNVSCTVLNNYFVKRRLLAFTLTHSTTALFCLLSPQLVKWSMEKYGSQGTLLLVSGIYMHNIFAMALMQPVVWHMKKAEVHEHEEKEMELLMADARELEANKNNFTYLNKSHISEHDIDEKHDSQIKIFVSRFIDLSLLKSYVLSNACVGVALCGCLDLLFIMMLPQALYTMGWNESEVATALSLNALVDLGTRIGMILMNNVFMKIGSHETYLAGLAIAFVSRIGMLWFESHTAILTFISIIGVSRCTINLLTPVVVADSVGQEKFSSALSLMVCIFGLANCTVAPLIGAIRDLTNSYSTAFYVLTSYFGIVVISWSIELLYKRTIRNRIPKMDASLKS